MAETPSTMLPLGTQAPSFELLDTKTNTMQTLKDIKSNIATVIMFICNHCPYVKHIQPRLVQVAKKYQEQGISFIAISANDAKNYPADGPDRMREEALKHGYTFPYLYDETQNTAKAYKAACTPDFYVFDHDLRCVYRGRFDSATPGNNDPITGNELCSALDAILSHNPISSDQRPSLGCNIKWKK